VTKLVLIGRRDPGSEERASQLALGSVFESTGIVSYEDSLREISRAVVCVLVEAGMKEGMYLPGKFTDYVIGRKPVLALSPAVGTISDMLPDPGVARVNGDDSAGVERAIGELYNDWRRGMIGTRRPSEGLVKTFEAKEVADRFLSLVERTMRPKPR
jgi:hypothetical protein